MALVAGPRTRLRARPAGRLYAPAWYAVCLHKISAATAADTDEPAPRVCRLCRFTIHQAGLDEQHAERTTGPRVASVSLFER